MNQQIRIGRAKHESNAAKVIFEQRAVCDDKHYRFGSEGRLIGRTIWSSSTSSSLAESPLRNSKAERLLIRAFDIVGSIMILVFAIPFMVLIVLLIKIFSPGPFLYKQERVGKNGIVFMLYKFRTMINNAEEHVGPVWASEDDSRVTPIGRILRRTRLDELPQLFNVLRGDMSLVGPRPERPFFVKQYQELQGLRLSVKPGITGLAQVRSFYNLKPNHKIKYDYLYIQKRSLLLNIYILLQTIPVLFNKKGW